MYRGLWLCWYIYCPDNESMDKDSYAKDKMHNV